MATVHNKRFRIRWDRFHSLRLRCTGFLADGQAVGVECVIHETWIRAVGFCPALRHAKARMMLDMANWEPWMPIKSNSAV